MLTKNLLKQNNEVLSLTHNLLIGSLIFKGAFKALTVFLENIHITYLGIVIGNVDKITLV